MEVILTKKFKENYDNNPFKQKPLRPFGGRLKKADAIKMKKIKSYNDIIKKGKFNLDFS
tara:strand:- start:33 stop:209 length:177 start_codon:yes stop_codon:yes gene_type:complete